MSDEIEERLRRLGRAEMPRLDATRVDAIAGRLLAEPSQARRASWILGAAAACAVAALVVTFAAPGDGSNSLQPSSPTETITDTVGSRPNPTSTVGQSTAPTSVNTPTTATTASQTPTVVATPAPTASTAVPATAAPTTQVPETIPSSSFALTVERVGGELHFSWPRFSGGGISGYVLIRVDAAGLTSWPADESRIAVTAGFDSTSATLTIRGLETRRWVLAVVGDQQQLIAVSGTTVSR